MRTWPLLIACRSNNSGAQDSAFSLARGAIICFLVVLPFGHNAALKNIALLGMLIAAIWLMLRRELTVDWRSPILLALAGFLLVMVVTSSSGVDPSESFGELRKHFLPGLLLFLLIPTTFRSEYLTRLLLAVIALAFMVRTGLTLIELACYFPDVSAGRSEGSFIKGFSLDAGLYVPVMVGLLLLGGSWRWLAPAGLLAIVAGMLLVQSRTPVAAAVVAIAAMLFFLRKWRLLAGSLTVFFASATLIGITQPEIAQRFKIAVSPQTYVKALDTKQFQLGEGFSGRTPIWFGVLEITKERFWVGYGFGWKKLGPIALDNGFVARWAAKSDDLFSAEQARYFSQQSSTVNPHNLYLQIYFESGILGLVAYLLMLLTLIVQSARISWRGAGLNRVLGAIVFAYLIDHVILGMFNGLLIGLGPSLALVALLETVRRSEKCA